jgi:hypothetical protein
MVGPVACGGVVRVGPGSSRRGGSEQASCNGSWANGKRFKKRKKHAWSDKNPFLFGFFIFDHSTTFRHYI